MKKDFDNNINLNKNFGKLNSKIKIKKSRIINNKLFKK